VLVACSGREGDGVSMMEQIDQAIGERDRLLAKIEILKGNNNALSKEWWRLRDENGHLKEKNEQLLEALNRCAGYDCWHYMRPDDKQFVEAALAGKDPRD